MHAKSPLNNSLHTFNPIESYPSLSDIYNVMMNEFDMKIRFGNRVTVSMHLHCLSRHNIVTYIENGVNNAIAMMKKDGEWPEK